MGKISDIWVRLGLKKEGFDKGMNEVPKQVQKAGGSMQKMLSAAKLGWAAVGTAVIAFGKQLINSSQRIGDAWARMTSQVKAGWDVVVQSIGAWNWDNFIGRIKEATIAAKALTNALDAEFEISNSIKLQKAAMAEELAKLEILVRDQTKTYKERADAADKYLKKVKPLYDQELQLAQKLQDAHLGKFLAGSGLEDTAQVRQDLEKFLVDIGKIPTLMDDLAAKSSAQKTVDKGVNAWKTNNKKVKEAGEELVRLEEKLREIQSGYQTDLVALFRAYNDMRGDEAAQAMVDAILRGYEAAAGFDEKTKRMQTALNTANAQLQESSDILSEIEQVIDNFELEIEDDFEIEPIDWDAIIGDPTEQLDEILAAWKDEQAEIKAMNDMLTNAIVTSMSNGMQAITDMIAGVEGANMAGVAAALLEPMANLLTQFGEMLVASGMAMSAFKKGFTTLDPAIQIAAGVGLIALGAAMSSGIRALANTGGGASTATTSAAGATSSAGGIETYEQEITVHVVGEISGDKIVLSGQKTLNKWSR